MLTDAETTRLIKLLGMLGSSFPGERASAAEKANELIRSKGLTWQDYITGGRSLKPEEKPQTTGEPTKRPFVKDGHEPVPIMCTIVHETQKALLIDAGTADGPVWIPKKCIIAQEPSKTNPRAHLIAIPKWLAIAKGIAEWSPV